MNELQVIREWMEEPLPVDDFLTDDFDLIVGDETRVEVNIKNVTYVYTEADARPVYEEDFGEVDPSHYDVYKNGMDWDWDGSYLCLTGDVGGIPCEAFWKLDRVIVENPE